MHISGPWWLLIAPTAKWLSRGTCKLLLHMFRPWWPNGSVDIWKFISNPPAPPVGGWRHGCGYQILFALQQSPGFRSAAQPSAVKLSRKPKVNVNYHRHPPGSGSVTQTKIHQFQTCLRRNKNQKTASMASEKPNKSTPN